MSLQGMFKKHLTTINRKLIFISSIVFIALHSGRLHDFEIIVMLYLNEDVPLELQYSVNKNLKHDKLKVPF